jgi:uncharacterized membrane protein YeaQ/YmgE (transglycosylase-associated protein family)
MDSLFYTLLIGLAAGLAAARLMKTSFGLLKSLILGVIGAFVGKFLFSLVGIMITTHFIGSFIAATVGASVLIWLSRWLR